MEEEEYRNLEFEAFTKRLGAYFKGLGNRTVTIREIKQEMGLKDERGMDTQEASYLHDALQWLEVYEFISTYDGIITRFGKYTGERKISMMFAPRDIHNGSRRLRAA